MPQPQRHRIESLPKLEDIDETSVRRLASAIVFRAVYDWDRMIGHHNPNFREIRLFLTEGLGVDLCEFLSLDSAAVLSKLEKHLYDYEHYQILPEPIPNYQKFI